MKILKSKKALSPVVASIILIAVTVAVSIAVAAWMGALTFTFMATEEITFTGHTWATDRSTIDITVKNTGTSALTISEVRVSDATNSSAGWTGTTALGAGESTTLTITGSAYLDTTGFVSGTKYAFQVITTKGNRFGPYTTTAP